MSVPAYPDYKDSGVAWVGQIPSHWDVLRLKVLFDLQKRPIREEDDIVTAFRDGVVTLRKNRREDGFTNALQEIGSQGIRAGDLVIHAMDGFAGAIGVSDSDGKSTPVYSVCKPRKGADSAYYGRLLRHMALTGFVNSLSKGVRERSTEFRWSDASVLPLPVPPQKEQAAINAFLDREVAKIDGLVAEQERLIALLKEKRQAVISHAVTKGLNPNAPMKESGIEWLGQIPAHWAKAALKHACSLVRDGTHQPPARVDDGVPLLSVRNIQDGRFLFREDDSRISIADYDELCRSFVPEGGDVLLAVVGATLGKSAIVPREFGRFHIQRSVAIFRPNQSTGPDWLNYLFLSDGFQRLLWSNVSFSAQPGIYLGSLENFQIPIPSLDEQSKIVEAITPVINSLEALVDEAQSAITLLQERRAALISAAVTGKIDVRAAVATPELEIA